MIKRAHLLALCLFPLCKSAPEVGKWDFLDLSQERNYIGMVKNAYAGSHLDIRVKCNVKGDFKVTVGYMLRRTVCWEEYLNLDTEEAKTKQIYQTYYQNPG